VAGNGTGAHSTPARVRVVTITVAALDWVNVGDALARLGVHDVTSVIRRPRDPWTYTGLTRPVVYLALLSSMRFLDDPVLRAGST
jgi:hypothetical protein